MRCFSFLLTSLHRPSPVFLLQLFFNIPVDTLRQLVPVLSTLPPSATAGLGSLARLTPADIQKMITFTTQVGCEFDLAHAVGHAVCLVMPQQHSSRSCAMQWVCMLSVRWCVSMCCVRHGGMA
jgi:hypothetical protein